MCHDAATVLFSLLYAVVHLLLEILIVRGRPTARLEAEVLALRHQLRVLERQVGRPRWQPADRLLLAAVSRVCPGRTGNLSYPAPRPCSDGTESWSVASDPWPLRWATRGE